MYTVLNDLLWTWPPPLFTCLELFITLYTKVQSSTNNSLLYIFFGNVVKSWWAIFLDQCAGLVAPLAGKRGGVIVHNSSKRNQLQTEFNKQECIPVGCVPFAAVAISPATKCPPAMHAPCYPCPPHHTCPHCHARPPAMHAPLPSMSPLPGTPPATHAPLPYMPPSPARHTPLPCTPPCHAHHSLWPEFLTHTCENTTFRNFVCGL